MLVLSRKVGESIIIEDLIEVTIVGVQGKYARVAIKAPKVIKVHRKEIYEKICQEREEEFLFKIAENNRLNEASAHELGINQNNTFEDEV